MSAATAAVARFPIQPRWGVRISPFFSEVLRQRVHDMQANDPSLTLAEIARRGNVHYLTFRYHLRPRVFLPRPDVFWGLQQALGLSAEEMFEAAYYTRP